MIHSVTIVTGQGVKIHQVGDDSQPDGIKIEKIVKQSVDFNGDPFDHYCGFDEQGRLLFRINCLIPCEVVYKQGVTHK